MIKEIVPFDGHFVWTENNMYTRYGPESWTYRIGGSDEPVNDCTALEAAFQVHASNLISELRNPTDQPHV